VISIVVVTHNRVHLLRRCVDDVLRRASSETREIVLWDNASTDATHEYLDTLVDQRIRVVRHQENIAMNARARALALTSQDYLIELDDDIVEAPPDWDKTLLDAYRTLPRIGRLGANLAYDPLDTASRYLRFMREERGAYPLREVAGIRVLEGTPGGGCTMISRILYEQVGGYREHRRHPYWRPEIPLERSLRKAGYSSALLADLEVRHAGGAHYSATSQVKLDYHRHEWKARARKDRVKRVLLALPFLRNLNERLHLFDPPAAPYDPATYEPDVPGAEAPDRTPAT